MIPNNMFDISREAVKAENCEGCGQQIGYEDFLLAMDGIKMKNVIFHSRCNPNDPDLQRHHKITLTPPVFGFNPKEIR